MRGLAAGLKMVFLEVQQWLNAEDTNFRCVLRTVVAGMLSHSRTDLPIPSGPSSSAVLLCWAL